MADDKQAATPDAEAAAGTFQAQVPTVADAPKGEVTVGDKAGAFGAWRAHQLIDAAASEIVGKVVPWLEDVERPRVLIVDDRALLAGDWIARHVRATLGRLGARVGDLENQLRSATYELADAVHRFEAERPGNSGRRGGDRPAPQTAGAAATPGTAPGAGSGAGGALGAAVNLLGLVRTDYAITATAVSAAPSELATLTAAHLAGRKIAGVRPPVVSDEFATVGRSPCADRLASVLAERDAGYRWLGDLQGVLAPVEAELAGLRSRIAAREQVWSTALVEGKDAAGTAALRDALDQDIAQVAARERAAGPARLQVARAQQTIADVDAAVAALLQSANGSDPPMLAAVRRERLDATLTEGRITHVLYVQLDAIAAEAVTRRSILGMSGRMRFLSADNASWLLLDAAGGEVTDGGQVSLADVMTFNLESGSAAFRTDGKWLESSEFAGREPLAVLETWAKVIVLVLVVVLFLVGALAVLAMVKVVTA